MKKIAMVFMCVASVLLGTAYAHENEPWYKDGDKELFYQYMSDWNKANDVDKLATCGMMVYKLYFFKKLKPELMEGIGQDISNKNMNTIKKHAQECVVLMDGLYTPEGDDLEVADVFLENKDELGWF